MNHQNVLEIIGEEGPIKAEDLAEELDEEIMKVRKELMRLSEENLVESFESEGSIFWKLKEENEEDRKIEKRAFQ